MALSTSDAITAPDETARVAQKKKPIVGDGQRLHTAIRCFTQGISMLINQCVDL
jgi:hypothetical protein